MTRDEYLAVLATEPATPNQVGAIRGECDRLGLGGDRDRRLAVCAAVLGLDGLGSTRDLQMGQAGRLVAVLREAGSLGALDAPDAPDGTAAAPRGCLIAEVVRLLAGITAMQPGPHETAADPATGPGRP
ncbi:MAG: hypothetical protein ACYCO9_06435 [Streptosporangiaceae bacterium]